MEEKGRWRRPNDVCVFPFYPDLIALNVSCVLPVILCVLLFYLGRCLMWMPDSLCFLSTAWSALRACSMILKFYLLLSVCVTLSVVNTTVLLSLTAYFGRKDVLDVMLPSNAPHSLSASPSCFVSSPLFSCDRRLAHLALLPVLSLPQLFLLFQHPLHSIISFSVSPSCLLPSSSFRWLLSLHALLFYL